MLIGAYIPPDVVVGGVVATALSIKMGFSTEVAITLAMPIALLSLAVGNFITIIQPFFLRLADKRAAAGNAKGVVQVQWMLGLIGTFRRFILTFLACYYGAGAVEGLINSIPAFVTTGMSAAAGLLPALGFAMLMRMILTKSILGVGLPLALQGNILGPLLYFLIYNIPAFWLRFFGVRKGYELGVSYLATFKESGLMDKLMKAANILGIMVIGCMTIEMVYTSFSLPIGSGETATSLQELLDGIMPGMVGLGVTWLYYYLISKKVKPMLLIIGTIVVGIVGALLGIFA